LQAVQKSREGVSHPDRNAQFEYINTRAADYLQRGEPVISADTKKKELVGNFKNGPREWQPTATPEKVLGMISPRTRRAKPFLTVCTTWGETRSWVRVGPDHDTPEFAVASIRQWWKMMAGDRFVIRRCCGRFVLRQVVAATQDATYPRGLRAG